MSGASMVFPMMWLVGLVVIVSFYRARIGIRRGAQVAITGLSIVIIYSVALAGTHQIALRNARHQASAIAASHAEQVLKVAAMPTLANPTEWLCILETDRATYKFQESLLTNARLDNSIGRFEKPSGTMADLVRRAEGDSRAQIFLEFARVPGFRVVGEDCLTQTLVQFADLRYTEPGKGRGTFSLEVPVDCPGLNSSNK